MKYLAEKTVPARVRHNPLPAGSTERTAVVRPLRLRHRSIANRRLALEVGEIAITGLLGLVTGYPTSRQEKRRFRGAKR